MTTKGNFKDVPIEHEFKMGTIVGVKKDASHGLITYATGGQELRYVYPTQWVEYNPVDPELCRTDMHLH